EIASIDAAASLRRERRTARAAANIALSPLDQHDPAPSLRGVAIDPIKVLHVGRVGLVAGLALVGETGGGRRRGNVRARRGGPGCQYAEQITAPDLNLAAMFHAAAPRRMSSSHAMSLRSAHRALPSQASAPGPDGLDRSCRAYCNLAHTSVRVFPRAMSVPAGP